MSNYETLIKTVPRSKLETLSQEQLIELIELTQDSFKDVVIENKQLKNKFATARDGEQQSILAREELLKLKGKLFGISSEKLDRPKKRTASKVSKNRVQLPSDRYPNADLYVQEVELANTPHCKCCQSEMKDSGMTEKCEFLDVVPARYQVVRQLRKIYVCGTCQSSVKTTPAPPRIKPSSGYSDEMVIDISMAKYCDLIPIGRYAQMAARGGLKGLPPNSLIEQTHYLADFVEGAYDKVKTEIMAAKVLHADETPHRMFEQRDKKKWYLWGFSSDRASYFECHNTRSGDVASSILIAAKVEHLASDKFSGYGKAVSEANKVRRSKKLEEIKNLYCNAHGRRKFIEAEASYPDEAGFFIEIYAKIYRLEKIMQARPPNRGNRKLWLRQKMKILFEKMKSRAMANLKTYPEKSSIVKAYKYLLSDYDAFVLFTNDITLPIDNNKQERELRNPVIGRKTWYGTHSRRGAETMAILFSLVQSCKLNGVNPREYIKQLVADLHQGNAPYTPYEYLAKK